MDKLKIAGGGYTLPSSENTNQLKFIDFFAGIGGFRRGMELVGHKCVGFCEFDKYAVASYTSMHLITNEQKEYLTTLPIKKRQKEVLKAEYRNGEWYANDIKSVRTEQLPKADCWCFGAPCQDFSVAGLRKGLSGDRSSLIREIFRLLEEQKEEDRPEWLIYENVKGMLSSNKGLDYLSILSELDRLGYDIEWQNINSKWFVPQNRERIYTIGHLRRFGSRKVFPITGADGENSISIIGTTHPNRHSTGDIHNVDGIMSTCTSRDYKQPKQIGIKIIGEINSSQDGQVHDISGISKCHSVGHNNSPKVAIPVLTPDRVEKRQNGRRFKENGEPMFTLTAQDRHGVGIKIKEATKQGYSIAHEGDSINFSVPGSQTRRGRVGHGIAQTLDTSCNQGIFVQVSDELTVYAIWYEKYQCYIAIRKLTPKECFRLQGWADDYFERAAFVNSDSQLYKQAGNGVTVNVIQAIGQKLQNSQL